MSDIILKKSELRRTLVDEVEDSLLRYLKDNDLRPGDSLPNEKELSEALGVGRAVLREALSRFKMNGMLISRPRVGMVLKEPSLFDGMSRCINPALIAEKTMNEIIEFRIALEVGISSLIFNNITEEDIQELEAIVNMSDTLGANRYTKASEHRFHSKLYEITGNSTIEKFQDIIYPILEFVKTKYQEYLAPIEKDLQASGRLVTHSDLLEYIKARDLNGYKIAIENHFNLYRSYLEKTRKK